MTPRPPPALITPLWTCDEIHVPCSAGPDSEETRRARLASSSLSSWALRASCTTLRV